jgi:hypothetical protein
VYSVGYTWVVSTWVAAVVVASTAVGVADTPGTPAGYRLAGSPLFAAVLLGQMLVHRSVDVPSNVVDLDIGLVHEPVPCQTRLCSHGIWFRPPGGTL